MASPLGKIVLKNCTKISLNERFTAYRQQAQNSVATYRQKIQAQRQASVENRRLAQQMANRPTVIAALRLKRKSLQQRLGQKRNTLASGSVKSRLSLASRKVQNRLGGMRSFRGGRSLGFRRGGYRGSFSSRPGTSPLIKSRLGTPFKKFNNARRGFNSMRRNFQGRTRRDNIMNQRQGISRRGQGARGRGGWGNKPVPTKQELDNQLDEYMAETKNTDGHLNMFISPY